MTNVAENAQQEKTIMKMAFEARDNAAEIDALRKLVAGLVEAINSASAAPMIDHSQKGRDVFSILAAALDRAKVAK